MTNVVDPAQIETIVGHARHATFHLGRAVSDEQTVYILHSQDCKDSGIDLRQCQFSTALGRGIDSDLWHRRKCEDRVVALAVMGGELFPVKPAWLNAEATR